MEISFARVGSILAIGTVLTGCETDELFQKKTAEFTNCSADNVQISDVNWSGGNTWKAICRSDARIYKCDKEGCTEMK